MNPLPVVSKPFHVGLQDIRDCDLRCLRLPVNCSVECVGFVEFDYCACSARVVREFPCGLNCLG